VDPAHLREDIAAVPVEVYPVQSVDVGYASKQPRTEILRGAVLSIPTAP
jgi:hypothetical protein